MRTTPERVAEAIRLRNDGWTYTAIGDRLGVHRQTVAGWVKGRVPAMFDKCRGCGEKLPEELHSGKQAQWCSEGCRKRHSYEGTCEVCGARTGYSGKGTEPNRVCPRHSDAVFQAKEKAKERTLQVIELRERGYLNYQIEERLGLPFNAAATLLNRAPRYGLTVPPSPYHTRGKVAA